MDSSIFRLLSPPSPGIELRIKVNGDDVFSVSNRR